MVLSDDSSLATWITISTLSAVRSSTFLILILPFSLALIIDSLIDSEVVENGISVITSVRLSTFEMRARTFTAPPRKPSLYRLASIKPPVGKSGKSWKSSPLRCAIQAEISSLKLCGRIFEAKPTAIPSVPCASKSGNLMGSVTGSSLRPSYERIHSVVFLLKTTSSANFDRRASIYRAAAASSPVRIFPQLP